MTRHQTLKYLIILLFGLVISLYLFYSINGKYTERNLTTVENASARAKIRIVEEISKINLVMESMGFFFENGPNVTPVLFKQFTDPFMGELYGIKALGWAPRIFNNQKQTYLEHTDELYDVRAITALDANSKVVVAEGDSIYFPITFINPLESHLGAIGYDLYSDSIRSAVIDRTMNIKKIAFSPPVKLIPQSGGGQGFLAIKSVYDSDSDEVKGIVLCVYRMDLFISRILPSELKILDIALYDRTAGNALLYSNMGNAARTGKAGLEILGDIKAQDRIWTMAFLPKPQFVSYPHSFESYVALFLTLVATFLLLIAIKKRDDYNQTLEQKVSLRTAELVASNKLKENLLREIHHRLKNNLQITSSLMNMQKRKLKSKEAITALEDSQARISAIALTHQKIYQDKDSKAVNLCEYLTDLMDFQKKLAPMVQFKISCPDTSIDLDRAVPLALIISELVTNALKHAYDDTSGIKELKIKATNSSDDLIVISITDNGHGLPDNFNIKKAEGIGFEIIHALCRQIAAEFSFDSNEEGTRFQLVFSNKAKTATF